MAAVDTAAPHPADAYARYTRVAIVLHWAIAAAILFQIGIGFLMADAVKSADKATMKWGFDQIQIHKAVGITILGLSVLRLAWRILHPAPPLPAGMGALERAGAHFSHVAFYALMIGLPLTGWAMVSVSVQYSSLPTTYFGLFTVPHLPFLESFATETRLAAEAALKTSHWLLGVGAVALLALHVGAALKHHYVDRDAVMARMVPGVAPRSGEPLAPPLAAWTGGRVLGAVALVGVASALTAALYWNAEREAAAAVARAPVEAPAAPVPAAPGATVWAPIMAESELKFSGSHAGTAFTGVFKTWRADIAFDPAALEASRVRVRVDTTSAKTGDAQYDGALPEADWFDARNHPQAVFEASTFRKGEGADAYVAVGTLTLKGVTKPVELPFTLTIEGDRAVMTGALDINRLDYGVGTNADASGDWVAVTIPLEIRVVATRGAETAAQ